MISWKQKFKILERFYEKTSKMDSSNRGNNFMSKYTNNNSDALRHLTSKQFFEVWNNYDQDGESSEL